MVKARDNDFRINLSVIGRWIAVWWPSFMITFVMWLINGFAIYSIVHDPSTDELLRGLVMCVIVVLTLAYGILLPSILRKEKW